MTAWKSFWWHRHLAGAGAQAGSLCHRPLHDFERGVSAGSAGPTHLCFDGQAKLGRPYPVAKLELEDEKKDCREDHLTFFLDALGAFVVKIKHHAAAGKTLYL
jgi:hypothetical protein